MEGGYEGITEKEAERITQENVNRGNDAMDLIEKILAINLNDIDALQERIKLN